MKLDWPICGHSKITKYLQTCLQSSNWAHAYLFVGPSRVGKTTLAKYFVGSLFCQDVTSKPCQKCFICKAVNHNTYPDYYSLETAEDKKQISIEQVRELISRLNKKPIMGKHQVAIIHGAEKMSLEACNALLKTLEEPAPNTLIILIADQDRLLSTIKSRCQVIKFQGVGDSEIVEFLKKGSDLPADELKSIAAISHGKIGWAKELSLDADTWASLQDEIQEELAFGLSQTGEKFKTIESIDTPDQISQKIQMWLTILTQIIQAKTQGKTTVPLENLEPYLKKDWSQIIKFAGLLMAAPEQISRNVNPRLVLENLFLNL
ncbi:DNA polymerase III subunit delta' [Candidatus Uhrbacteria bacterium]|nr:DNA polymerase III subunit delta' [Candidatus Uhrbacteria bacterium]